MGLGGVEAALRELLGGGGGKAPADGGAGLIRLSIVTERSTCPAWQRVLSGSVQ